MLHSFSNSQNEKIAIVITSMRTFLNIISYVGNLCVQCDSVGCFDFDEIVISEKLSN